MSASMYFHTKNEQTNIKVTKSSKNDYVITLDNSLENVSSEITIFIDSICLEELKKQIKEADE
jgi:hypothetical protein